MCAASLGTFVFGTTSPYFTSTASDQRASDTVRAYWRSFILKGVPSPEGLPAWPRYDPDRDVIIDFQLEGPVVGPDPARERLDLAEAVTVSRREAEQSK